MNRKWMHVSRAYVLSQISKRLKLGFINSEPKALYINPTN